MHWIAWVLIVLAVCYLIFGGALAFHEKSQTDDSWNWKIVFMWPLIFLGMGGR